MRKIVIWLVILLSTMSVVQAQDESRVLQTGVPLSGVIDIHHLTQMYSFTSKLPASSGIKLQNTGALPLKVVIIDSTGTPLTHVDDIAPATEGGIDSWQPPADGTYFVVIYPTEALNNRTGSFILTRYEYPQPLSATGVGLQFELDWQAGARLSLEIRDPLGQSIHWKNTTTTDGGSFVGDTDPIDCKTFTPHAQMQAARWQGAVEGSYEILVHTIDGCANSVPFTLSVKLNDQTYPALSGTSQANSTFVSGFAVSADGTGGLSAQSGMVSTTPTLAIQTAQLVSTAEALPTGGVVTDQIDDDHPYHSYRFEGQLGDTVSAVVKRTSGSLDTLIALLDTNGNLLAINDDSAADTTDSAINGARLRHSGTYLIVVTRYAQMIGATAGGFELTVTGVKG